MSEAIRPDGVYGPDGKPIDGYSGIMKEAILAVPNFAKLLWRLGSDSRVPTGSKVIMYSSLAYLLFPIDFIPDVIPGVGHQSNMEAAGLFNSAVRDFLLPR